MTSEKRQVAVTLAALCRRSPVPALARIAGPLRANYTTLDEIYAIGASGADFGERADRRSGVAAQSMGANAVVIAEASREYDRRAPTAPATPMRCAAGRSRWARRSSPSATRSTRWSPSAPTAPRCRRSTPSTNCAAAPARSSTRASSMCSACSSPRTTSRGSPPDRRPLKLASPAPMTQGTAVASGGSDEANEDGPGPGAGIGSGGDRRHRALAATLGRQRQGRVAARAGQDRAEPAPERAVSLQPANRRIACGGAEADADRQGRRRRHIVRARAAFAAWRARRSGDAVARRLRGARRDLRHRCSGADFGERADRLAGDAGRASATVARLLDSAGHEYGRRAAQARTQASIGSAAVILLLLVAFGFLYRRSVRARASVERSEERFRTLVANIPGAVYRRAADADWSMQCVSHTIVEITGYGAAEFIDGERTYASIVDPTQRDWAAIEMTTSPEHDAFSVEYPIVHADGSTRWGHDKGQPIRDAAGEILQLDGTISDITDVKRLEQERERIALELRVSQRLEAVGQLAAGIAHEINTPVQFVSDSIAFLKTSIEDLRRLIDAQHALYADALDGRDDAAALHARLREAEEEADLEYLDERIPAALDRTVDGLSRISAIVGAMRDFGRPQQHDRAPADLDEALRTTLVVAQSEYKYIADLETEFGDLPPLLCNVSELNQVFLNLVVNAAHAIAEVAPSDGIAKGVIRIRTTREADTAVITVSDTGPGIAPEIRERIFDPFFTTKDVGRGTGQGLAISHSIVVDKHRGTLTVDSELGRGTTFTVRLPMTPETSALPA